MTSVEVGELLDLARERPVDETAMRSWGGSRTVRAAVIREIMRGRLASEADPHGIRLRGARVVGRLDLENVASAVWLELHDCLLEEGLNVRDAKLAGVVLTGSRLEHPTEPPLSAGRLTAENLEGANAVIAGHCSDGAISVRNAQIGEFRFLGAKVTNDSGAALLGDRLRVKYAMYLRDGFEAVGTGKDGAIRLLSAHVGSLDLSGARLINDSGPALFAEQSRVDRDANLGHGFEATGSGSGGTIYLNSAHVGALDCRGACLRNDSGSALIAEHLQVDRHVYLSGGFEARAGGAGVAIDLSGARLGGLLIFSPARLEHRDDPQRRLALNGLIYARVPQGVSMEDWLRLIREGTAVYATQPYQQLACGYREAGHDGEARRVQIARRHDQLERKALTGRFERSWARITGLTLGYGYQPWRALLGLLAVVLVAVLLAVVLGGQGGLVKGQSPAPPTPAACAVIERVGFGLDLGNPLITSGSRARCEVADTAAGRTLTIAGWVLRLLAWAFATLFIAGFTDAVRKT